MRGVVSASMLTALEDRGFADAFDAVYGHSSGAINAAYFLAGETWYPLSIYYDDLTTKQFVDFRRALRRGNILNLNYAFDQVMEVQKPLRYEAVLTAPIPLTVAVTLVDELRTECVQSFENREHLKKALQASTWLPIGVRGTADFNGERAIDGGLLTPLPFRLALADGCTHTLSLSTMPIGARTSRALIATALVERYLERLSAGLGAAYVEAQRRKLEDKKWLANARVANSGSEPFVLDLAPLPETVEVKRHELNAKAVIDATRSSYEVMYAALEAKPIKAIREGSIRAIPRLTIVERNLESTSRRIFVSHHA